MTRSTRAIGRVRRSASRLLAALCLTVVAIGGAAANTSLPPAQSIERLFHARSFDSSWFAPTLLSQASTDTLQQAVRDLVDSNGKFQGVAPRQNEYVVELQRALVPTVIAFDAEGRISSLFFRSPVPRFTGIDDAKNAFTALPGKIALLVLEDGKPLLAINDDRPLAVGSAFKLAVLAALADTVNDGKLAWATPETLKSDWTALPTGILQGWPAGSLLTVQTLAGLMISLSDNTAADALMQLVGRERIEAIVPRNKPFLTPREFFILRAYPNQQLRHQFLAASEAQRRALLATIDGLPLPPFAAFSSDVISGIEWYFSARELCGLLEKLHALPAFRINPGLAIPSEWREVAFKGGGDKGVLNLTTWAQSQNQHGYCVAATWNDDKPLDDQRMEKPYGELLDWLSRQQ